MTNQNQITENYEQAPEAEKQTLEDKVVAYLQSNEIPIDKSDISTCHTLPINDRSKPKPIVNRMISRKSKIEVLKTERKRCLHQRAPDR